MGSALIKVYTDGSCSPNPGPGGWAAIVLFDKGNRVVELKGAEPQATNNRMELTAALKALESLEENSDVEVLTDSKYLERGISKWLRKWKSNGWITAEGHSVKNRDLWETFSIQLERHNIIWTWIKGHNKNIWNDRVDEIATAVRRTIKSSAVDVDRFAVQLYTGVTWKPSKAKGSWAIILQYGPHYRVIGGTSESTTANRLYLHAVIEGLLSLKRIIPVYIHTRSGYLRDGMEIWLDSWSRKNWITRDGNTVSNVEQWRKLAKLKEKYSIKIIPVSSEEPPCLLQEAKELAREFDN